MNRAGRRRLGSKSPYSTSIKEFDGGSSTGTGFGLPESGIKTFGGQGTYNPGASRNVAEETKSESASGDVPAPGQESWAGVAWAILRRIPIVVIIWLFTLAFFFRHSLTSLNQYRTDKGYAVDRGDYEYVFAVALLPETLTVGSILLAGIPILLFFTVKTIWRRSKEKKARVATSYISLGILLCLLVLGLAIRIFGISPWLQRLLNI